MANKTRNITVFAFIATFIAFVVIGLGAYTRLKDAGLSCPDWPTCYGHITVPEGRAEITRAEKAFPNAEPVQPAKAWAEMTHRYVAGVLALCCFILAIIALVRGKDFKGARAVGLGLAVLIVYQAILGMWTVTWELLPLVVTMHLIGGFIILSLLWLYTLQTKNYPRVEQNSTMQRFRPWAVVGLLVVFAQILLGGWTSTNYAALICPDFPLCHGQLLPHMNFTGAFSLLHPIGLNYDGGVLGAAARTAIQMTHRLGALITFLYIGILSIVMLVASRNRVLRKIAIATLVVLCLQVSLGIMNVLLLLPLWVAVLHNLIAALLLVSLVTMNYFLYVQPRTSTVYG